MKNKFICYTPFTGLGMYGGFRGNRWLRNRIEIFKKFVIPAMLNQTDKDFVHWISWRKEEEENPLVEALAEYLSRIPGYQFVFTFSGVCFWDDKYEQGVAQERLFRSLKGALPTLMPHLSDCDQVYWLLVPSDDLYDGRTISLVRKAFEDPAIQAVTYAKGYICNYNTLEVLEYNPITNPPFFAIKFDRTVFFDPGKHMNYTGPYKSHEYIGNKLKLAFFDFRGFMVGTHGENISTHFNHPYGGDTIDEPRKSIVLEHYGMGHTTPLELPISTRKWVMRRLPYRWQRKLRYVFGERLYNRFYNFIRN